MRKLKAGIEATGQRLDRWLSDVLDISRSQAKKIFQEGRLLIDGQSLKASDLVERGLVYDYLEKEEEDKLLAQEGPLEILYEDDWLLVVAKPQGQLTHPVRAEDPTSLASALLAHGPLADFGDPLRPGILHRLDKDTSGLLLVAKEHKAGLCLLEDIRNQKLERRYLALVEGHPEAREFVLEHRLVKGRKNPLKRQALPAEAAEGLWARMEAQLLFHDRLHSLLACRLETGRTHQIRVQLAAIGLPIVGDPLYGRSQNSFAFKGQALHCHYLSFLHPIRAERMQFRLSPPNTFRRAMKVLAKDYRKEEGF